MFDGLEWPLERWQLLVAADEYGISPRLCDRLARVPHRRYEDLTEVEYALGTDESTSEQA